MTHEYALNFLLANACGMLSDDELKANGGWQEHHIALHCQSYVIVARHLGNLVYEVKDIRREPS